MNIVKFNWVLACIERGFLVDLEPVYMLHANEKLLEYFRDNQLLQIIDQIQQWFSPIKHFKDNLDPYNDHYTQFVDPKRLTEILDQIPNDKIEFQIIDTDPDIEQIFTQVGCRGLFYGKKFYLIRSEGVLEQMTTQFDMEIEYQSLLHAKFAGYYRKQHLQLSEQKSGKDVKHKNLMFNKLQNEEDQVVVKCVDKIMKMEEFNVLSKLRLYGAILLDFKIQSNILRINKDNHIYRIECNIYQKSKFNIIDSLPSSQHLTQDHVDYIILTDRVGDKEDIQKIKQVAQRRGLQVVDIKWLADKMKQFEDKIINDEADDNDINNHDEKIIQDKEQSKSSDKIGDFKLKDKDQSEKKPVNKKSVDKRKRDSDDEIMRALDRFNEDISMSLS